MELRKGQLEEHKQSDTFCALAWVHTSSEPYGTCRSCCIARSHIKDNKDKILTLQDNTIADVLNSPYMINLRREMIEGKKPKQCQTCWSDEDNGKESKRLLYNKLIKEWNFKINNAVDNCSPRDIQINIGNTCNLKCRTCSPICSSKWVKEWKDRGRDYWIAEESINNEFNDYDNSKFWTDIDTWSQTVQRIEIMGGEPFYNKSFKKLVNRLIDNGSSKKISINLSTNGTIYDDNLMRLILSNFKAVGVNISIDGINEHFDYIRHGVPWEKVKQNLDSFFNLYSNQQEYKDKDGWWRFSMSYTITIGILNIHYLRDIHEFFEKNYINKTGIDGLHYDKEVDGIKEDAFEGDKQVPRLEIWNNVVYYPSYYSSNNMPEEIKDTVLHRVTNPEDYGLRRWNDKKYKNDIMPIVNHTKTKSGNREWITFVNETIKTDEYRKENFEKTFSELFKIFKPYWVEAVKQIDKNIISIERLAQNKG